MRKIIDVSSLRSEAVVDYLRASPLNFAVLPDYASMESFKGSGDTNVRRSLLLLSSYVDQVLILKPTGVISLLKPRSKGLAARLIDNGHTESFRSYCRELFATPSGTGEITRDIAIKQKRANRHFEKLTSNVEELRDGITLLESTFTPEQTKILRSGSPITAEIADRIVSGVMLNAQALYAGLGFRSMPQLNDAIYGFPFRYALTGYAEALWWIQAGGHRTVAATRLRNDFTDAIYAAYGTLFDGVISEDKKLREVYVLSKTIMHVCFKA